MDEQLAHRALGLCEQVLAVYPHPGCAEFGPPDEFVCENTVRWMETVDFEGHVSVMGVCDDHRSSPQDFWLLEIVAVGAL